MDTPMHPSVFTDLLFISILSMQFHPRNGLQPCDYYRVIRESWAAAIVASNIRNGGV